MELHNHSLKYVKKFNEEGKFIAAICASPSIFGRAGLLKGKKFTCFPGYEAECKGGEYTGSEAEWDGNVITGRSAGCAVPFALKIIEAIDGRDTAKAMADKICYDHYE